MAARPVPPLFQYTSHSAEAGRTAARHRQTGSGMAEFLLVAGALLLLALGGIELARWMAIRQAVDLALLQAARAGATQHAAPAVIAARFERALAPLFADTSPAATANRLAQALQRRRIAMKGAPPWQIRILNPDDAAYARFSTPGLSIAGAAGLRTINNDYQSEQHQQRQNTASTSQDAIRTIFTANQLVLRLTYPHEPLLPGMAALLSHLEGSASGYARQVFKAGLLPIVRVMQLDMASHPVDWPPLANGRVVKGALDAALPPSGAVNPQEAPACRGLWCVDAIRPFPGIDPSTGTPPQAGSPGSAPPPAQTDPSEPSLPADDAAAPWPDADDIPDDWQGPDPSCA